MSRRGVFGAGVAAFLVAVMPVGCSDGAPVTSMAPTTTSTTTTIAAAGTTSTTESPDDNVTDPVLEELPDSFVIEFEERYLCDLGPYGFSDIHANGPVTVGTLRAPTAITFYGRGALDIEASLRAGEVCSGSAAGSHSIEEISGTVEYTSSGEPELQLYVNGAWYQTFVGEIICAPEVPSLGPWEWPTELHSEYIFFSPIENDAVWEKEVSLGRCTGTITRRLDFESVPVDAIPVP